MSGYTGADAETIPHCYRHPDRETYISCQRCGRPICPDCMRDASVGFQCPECVRESARTTPQVRTSFGGVAAVSRAYVTVGIILTNVVLWIAANATNGDKGWVVKHLALWTDIDVPRFGYEGVAQGAYWQLITSAFLHVDPLHIFMNMIGLWIFGSFLEYQLGWWRYLALYLISGLAGSTLVYLTTPAFAESHRLNYTLGASGAVFGLFGAALLILLKQRRDVTPLLVLLAFNLVFTFVGSGISWQGHVGGLAAGLALGAGFAYAPRQQRTLYHGAALVATLLICIALVVLRTSQLTG